VSLLQAILQLYPDITGNELMVSMAVLFFFTGKLTLIYR
jgi:hypothetical protein